MNNERLGAAYQDSTSELLDAAETKLARIEREGSGRRQVKALLHTMAMLASGTVTDRRVVRKHVPHCAGMAVLIVALLVVPLHAQQSPWGNAATKLGQEFTGPIARGFALVAIVVGGLTIATSDGGGRRTIGALVFGLGLALGAAQFVTWLFN